MSAVAQPIQRAKPRDSFWDGTLSYAHAFVTVMAAVTLGLAFHVWIGYEMLQLLPPVLLAIAALAPLLGLAIWARLRPGHRVVKWLTGIPFAVVSCIAFAGMAIAGGIVPQSVWAERFGLASFWGAWPLLMVGYLLAVNLVGSCGRRCWPLTYTNVVYQATHLGLAIALIGGAYSGLTLERRRMVLFKGMPTRLMIDEKNEEFQAPFEVVLRDFRMEVFRPSLTLATLDEKSPDGLRQSAGSLLLDKGVKETVDGHHIVVEKFYKHAAFDGLEWREVPWHTAAPAAFLKVTAPDGTTKSGWISCGSPETMPAYLMLRDDQAILMNSLRPKKFESDITIDGKNYTIGVNSPARIDGYDIYQFSYDEKMGAASAYSIIEVVHDRGLPIVYLGMFVMLAGTLMHLGNGIGGRR